MSELEGNVPTNDTIINRASNREALSITGFIKKSP
jgi:hypothetical protein